MSNITNVKISQLPEVSTTTGTDRFLVVQGGVSKQILLNKLFNGLVSNQSFNFNVLNNDFKVTNAEVDILTVKGDVSNNVGIFNSNPLSKLHIGGSVRIGNSAIISSMTTTPAVTPGIFITPYELIRNSGTISVSNDTTLLSLNTATTYVLTDGINGQNKTIVLFDVVNGAMATIQATHAIGFASIKLSSASASVTLKFVADNWIVVGSVSASIT